MLVDCNSDTSLVCVTIPFDAGTAHRPCTHRLLDYSAFHPVPKGFPVNLIVIILLVLLLGGGLGGYGYRAGFYNGGVFGGGIGLVVVVLLLLLVFNRL